MFLVKNVSDAEDGKVYSISSDGESGTEESIV
jgi:hypothetical protein